MGLTSGIWDWMHRNVRSWQHHHHHHLTFLEWPKYSWHYCKDHCSGGDTVTGKRKCHSVKQFHIAAAEQVRLEPVLNTASDKADVTSLGRPFHMHDLQLLTDGKLKRQADPCRRTWACVSVACRRHMWMTVQSRGVEYVSIATLIECRPNSPWHTER